MLFSCFLVRAPRDLCFIKPVQIDLLYILYHIDDQRGMVADGGGTEQPFLFQCGVVDGDADVHSINGRACQEADISFSYLEMDHLEVCGLPKA